MPRVELNQEARAEKPEKGQSLLFIGPEAFGMGEGAAYSQI